ncbi:agmatine deiminase family protein [Lewinella sp. 4G2]|uniref:agmatine deiminase family protein n=1 Tax=Lewinella sp. 4G2 TaxID=1803372 RepID=UPI0007B45FD2|nr:agmatine deiminase family protein [Lewinella sp. 4G2]OAV45580.1 hypothetical protein A3850_014240 [Lewinella sp. 4G2]
MSRTDLRLPAEWEKQSLVLFAFPRSEGDWGEYLDAASTAMINAANAVNKVCPTLLIVSDLKHFELYRDSYLVEVAQLANNDSWVRDYGPITCYQNGRRVMKHFDFNGWGGKFSADLDTLVTRRLADGKLSHLDYEKVPFELEGGSIESNGAGTILTTKKCLLNSNRNGGRYDQSAVEKVLRERLGGKLIHWLEHGDLEGDDTDAHIDTLARFLDAETIAYVRCDDPTDIHFHELQLMEDELRQLRTQEGRPYRLIPLPWPPVVHSPADGRRLPATYANFLISNGTVFVPTYFDSAAADHPGKQADQRALATIAEAVPYEVTPIPSRPFLEQHGSLHCLTMQMPAPLH